MQDLAVTHLPGLFTVSARKLAAAIGADELATIGALARAVDMSTTAKLAAQVRECEASGERPSVTMRADELEKYVALYGLRATARDLDDAGLAKYLGGGAYRVDFLQAQVDAVAHKLRMIERAHASHRARRRNIAALESARESDERTMRSIDTRGEGET